MMSDPNRIIDVSDVSWENEGSTVILANRILDWVRIQYQIRPEEIEIKTTATDEFSVEKSIVSIRNRAFLAARRFDGDQREKTRIVLAGGWVYYKEDLVYCDDIEASIKWLLQLPKKNALDILIEVDREIRNKR